MGGTDRVMFLSSWRSIMATAATTDIAKVVRRVLDEELGDDSEAMLKGIQRVTRLLTDQVIPKLSDESDEEAPEEEDPTPTKPPALRGVTPAPEKPGGKPVPDQPGAPEGPEPDEPPAGDLPEGAVEALEALYSRLSADQFKALASFFTAISGEPDEEGDTGEGGMAVRRAAPDALTTLATRKPAAFQAAVDALTPYVAEEEDGTFSLAAPKRVISELDADAYAALTGALDRANQMMRDAAAGGVGARGIKIPWKLIWRMCARLGRKLPWYKIACAMAVVARNHHKYPGNPPQPRWLQAAARNVIGSCR